MIGSPLCKFGSICTSTLLNGQMEVVNERPIFIYNVYLSLFIPAIMDSKFQLSRALCKQDDIYRWTSYSLKGDFFLYVVAVSIYHSFTGLIYECVLSEEGKGRVE